MMKTKWKNFSLTILTAFTFVALAFGVLLGGQKPISAKAENGEVTISSLAELEAFRDAVNGGNTYEGYTVSLETDLTLSGEWTSVGNGSRSGNSYTGNSFKGTFDGKNHTVTGLTVTSGESAATAGLFGVVDGGTVQNLVLENVSVNLTACKNAGAAVGVMVNDAKVSNVSVSGSVSAPDGVGGVVGRVLISGTVENCTNSASVTATATSGGAGGIVGKAYYTAIDKFMTVSSCSNTGAITSGYAAGGIVGFSAANVYNCTNSGKVEAMTEGGGIVGEQVNYGTLSKNTNTADVFGEATAAGGIVGWVRYQTSTADYGMTELVQVINNTNSGSISKGEGAGSLGYGGIVGTVYNQAWISGNENTASSIEGGTFAAGILGGAQIATNNQILDGETITVTHNVSTTALENITGNCKDTYAYMNASTFVNSANSDAWAATIGEDRYTSVKAAIRAAQEGETVELVAGTIEEGTIQFPATLKNVTIKGSEEGTVLKNSSFNSADGSSVCYENITIDGIAFDNSYILFTAGRTNGVTYMDWTITNCEFKNVATQAAVAFSGGTQSEAMQNFTFTNNVIDGVLGTAKSGLCVRASNGNLVIKNNTFKNIAWNAIQMINVAEGATLSVKGNVFSSNADEGVVNFYNNNGEITFAENQIITLENQPGLCYIDALDVSNNYWGGGAPENLAEGITCGTYYTEVTEEGTLSGMLCAVTFDCSSISVSETDGYVSSEEDYVVTLSVSGNTCISETVEVWVGDVQLEIGTHYTYENTTGKLTVLKEYLTASVKIVEGEATGHNFADATCTTPKTCTVCQATEGDVLPHAYNDATCQEPKTCPDCGATEGEVKPHVDADTDYKCDDCGENLPMTGTPAIIWAAIIAVVSAACVLSLVCVTKKKRS